MFQPAKTYWFIKVQYQYCIYLANSDENFASRKFLRGKTGAQIKQEISLKRIIHA